MSIDKKNRRKRIHFRIRKKVSGTAERPRLAVYRSNKSIYCQLIDDLTGNTIGSAASIDSKVDKSVPKTEQAKQVGTLIGQVAKDHNISDVIFDRGGYLYHGRVKALAEGARETGLKF
jgi:large subunit ribosomal protein L18